MRSSRRIEEVAQAMKDGSSPAVVSRWKEDGRQYETIASKFRRLTGIKVGRKIEEVRQAGK